MNAARQIDRRRTGLSEWQYDADRDAARPATVISPVVTQWEREHSPAPIETKFIENPVVTAAPGGGWLAVYDSQPPGTIGWAYSADGIAWEPGDALVVQPTPGTWAKDVRTPLGLVPEGDGQYTIFYTGFEQNPDWPRLLRGKGKETCAIGFVEVRVE